MSEAACLTRKKSLRILGADPLVPDSLPRLQVFLPKSPPPQAEMLQSGHCWTPSLKSAPAQDLPWNLLFMPNKLSRLHAIIFHQLLSNGTPSAKTIIQKIVSV